MPVARTERECVAVSFSLMLRIEFSILWCGATNEWMNERTRLCKYIHIYLAIPLAKSWIWKMTTLLQKLSGWNIYEVIKLNNMHTPESHSDFNKIWIKWCWPRTDCEYSFCADWTMLLENEWSRSAGGRQQWKAQLHSNGSPTPSIIS